MSTQPDMTWFNEAKFGMFIHWGLYALPAGNWQDMETPSISEWLMHKFKIPANEYAKLAESFNPINFDAEKWVDTAQAAGMNYMVVTSKHHEGFAMFKSESDPYNIVDATPFKRDPLKELADACEKKGMKLGFYYSQDQDWHHPGGSGNYWDYSDRTDADFANYLENKVKPQLKELLTDYGKVALIWFDTPMTISKSQSQMLKDYVHSFQPECLVSGRVGHGLGDYQSLKDNETPERELAGNWEGLGTMNNSWGYKPADQDWKTVPELLEILIKTASCGANYLLNVGPGAKGEIPAINIDYLKEMGDWLKINGDAIYGTTRTPKILNVSKFFRYIRMTAKPEKLFVFMLKNPGKLLAIFGFKNQVKSARILSQPDNIIEFNQIHKRDDDYDKYTFQIPEGLDFTLPQVLEISVEGDLETRWDAYTAGCFNDKRWEPPINRRTNEDIDDE